MGSYRSYDTSALHEGGPDASSTGRSLFEGSRYRPRVGPSTYPSRPSALPRNLCLSSPSFGPEGLTPPRWAAQGWDPVRGARFGRARRVRPPPARESGDGGIRVFSLQARAPSTPRAAISAPRLTGSRGGESGTWVGEESRGGRCLPAQEWAGSVSQEITGGDPAVILIRGRWRTRQNSKCLCEAPRRRPTDYPSPWTSAAWGSGRSHPGCGNPSREGNANRGR